MTVDQAIEALRKIKLADPNSGSYNIGDEGGDNSLCRFYISDYATSESRDYMNYVAYETDEWWEDE